MNDVWQGNLRVKQNTLTITSLLSIFLMTFHLSDDIVRGFFFVWPLGVTAVFSVILSARGLWSLRRDQARSSSS